MCIYIYIYIYTYIYAERGARWVCRGTRTSSDRPRRPARERLGSCIYLRICIYVCMCMCIYAYIHIYIYIYTYLHIVCKHVCI